MLLPLPGWLMAAVSYPGSQGSKNPRSKKNAVQNQPLILTEPEPEPEGLKLKKLNLTRFNVLLSAKHLCFHIKTHASVV